MIVFSKGLGGRGSAGCFSDQIETKSAADVAARRGGRYVRCTPPRSRTRSHAAFV